jgi:hypothetical protein
VEEPHRDAGIKLEPGQHGGDQELDHSQLRRQSLLGDPPTERFPPRHHLVPPMHFRIDQDPTLVTRTRYEFLATANAAARGIDDDVLHGRGLAGYDVFAGACPDQLDKDPLKDLDKLANATAVVKTYTDERICHIGHAANVGALTFGDLDRGIDAVGDPGAQVLPAAPSRKHALVHHSPTTSVMAHRL